MIEQRVYLTAVPAGALPPNVITRLQLRRGQAIRFEQALHNKRQLQGQRTYFLPGGAARIGVASLQ